MKKSANDINFNSYTRMGERPNPETWIRENNLILIEGWARDGYSYDDIARQIGIARSTLTKWRDKYPELDEALESGREVVDYKVENALLKAALGYKTKEVRVCTTMVNGKLTQTENETITKEVPPSVSAIQVWLYNRSPDKWRKNQETSILTGDDDNRIQITVTRATSENDLDTETWEESTDENSQGELINHSVEVRPLTAHEKAERRKKYSRAKSIPKVNRNSNKTEIEYLDKEEEKEYKARKNSKNSKNKSKLSEGNNKKELNKKSQNKSQNNSTGANSSVFNKFDKKDLDFWPDDWEEEIEDEN